MVNLNDLVDWAVILAVALYFGGRRRDGIMKWPRLSEQIFRIDK
jgi:hypothetical protein